MLAGAFMHESERPDAIFLTQPIGGGQVRDYTWREAMDEARRMAAHLRSLNLPPKSQIALIGKNSAHWILTDLAIFMAGHVTVPLYPTLAAETVRYILEHSESKLLFVGKLDTWDDMKSGVPADLPRIYLPLAPKNEGPTWEEIIAKTEPLGGKPDRDPKDLATIMYTSGTTGQPKGVMHSFETMTVSAQGIAEILKLNADDRVLSYLPLSHAFERFAIETPALLYGGRIFFAESLDTFADDLRRAKPTLFISVPRLWVKFQQGVHAKMPPKKLDLFLKIPILSSIVKKKVLTTLGLDSVRFAGSGSAPIPGEVIAWYRRLGLELLEGYGMSENFSFSHVNMPGRSRIGYVGEPYPNVSCRISPEGEVLVKSPGTMLGYFKAPEATKEAFTEDGFLKTGDRGEIDELGRLKITGRVKELFKTSKGKYVAPSPIENKLIASGIVEQSCVTGPSQPQPHALVVLSEDLRKELSTGAVSPADVTTKLSALRDEVNATLDPHEHLEFIAVVKEPWVIENGFLTPTMKVKRGTVEQAYGPLSEDWYAARKKVIWQE
ncbi:MAG: AMP-binding protein [Polyangiaceae bacterium]|nr:AMP-binding protein [Polyangiaceae bacterium]